VDKYYEKYSHEKYSHQMKTIDADTFLAVLVYSFA
jgi:hypothetical protein